MPRPELETLLTWLDPLRKPLLAQLPEAAYERLINRWTLPKLTNADRRRAVGTSSTVQDLRTSH